MQSAPRPYNELRRLRALTSYALLEQPSDTHLALITKMAALETGCPIGMLNFIFSAEQRTLATFGEAPALRLPRDLSICAHTILSAGVPSIIPDLRLDRRCDGLLTGPLENIRAYAGVPVIDADGFVLGALCVMNVYPTHFGDNTVRMLAFLAQAAAGRLETYRLAKELSRMGQQATPKAESGISRSIASFVGATSAGLRRKGSNHDMVTNVGNHRLLSKCLVEHVSSATLVSRVVLLNLDIDGFRGANEALGHDVGDQLLHQVASRLSSWAGSNRPVARSGGDEFSIICPGVAVNVDPLSLARQAVANFDAPFINQMHRVFLHASVGVSVAPEDSSDPECLRRNAHSALARAKRSGRGAIVRYRLTEDDAEQRREDLLLDLPAAIQGGEFSLVYQPIIDLTSDRIVGYEALLRWTHPKRGSIPPSEFIPMAENSGYIRDLGLWALSEACRVAATWPDHIYVAVNVSTKQLLHRELDHDIAAVLNAVGLPPSRLELEITESSVLEDSKSNIELLKAIRSLGVSLSIDDFGAGYATINYLRKFPFSGFKIDQSLLAGLPDGAGGDAILRLLITLGDQFGMKVTIEGVETLSQLNFVRSLNCPRAQGYIFGRPEPASAATALLGTGITKNARNPLSIAS